MRDLRARIRRIPPLWRWAALLTLALLVVGVAWFFLRPDLPALPDPPTPRPAAGKVVAYTDYTAAVERALQEARAARSATGTDRTQAIERAVAALESVEGASVTPDGGLPAEVDNTAFIRQLEEDEPDLEEIEQGLAALSAALGAQQGQVVGTLQGEQANAELRRVLQDPAFDYESRLSPIRRLARWLSELTGEADPDDTLWLWITSLMAGVAVGVLTFLASEHLGKRWLRLGLSVLAGILGAGVFYTAVKQFDITTQILGLVGLVVAVVAVAFFLSGLYRSSAPPAQPRAISELAQVLGMNAAEARRRAQAAAEGGDYRGAIRFRCLAVLLTLDEAGRLVFDRTATNREYLFRAPGPLQEHLQPLLTRFDEVWYGESPTTADEWAQYNARAETVEGMVLAERRAA